MFGTLANEDEHQQISHREGGNSTAVVQGSICDLLSVANQEVADKRDPAGVGDERQGKDRSQARDDVSPFELEEETKDQTINQERGQRCHTAAGFRDVIEGPASDDCDAI